MISSGLNRSCTVSGGFRLVRAYSSCFKWFHLFPMPDPHEGPLLSNYCPSFTEKK